MWREQQDTLWRDATSADTPVDRTLEGRIKPSATNEPTAVRTPLVAVAPWPPESAVVDRHRCAISVRRLRHRTEDAVPVGVRQRNIHGVDDVNMYFLRRC